MLTRLKKMIGSRNVSKRLRERYWKLREAETDELLADFMDSCDNEAAAAELRELAEQTRKEAMSL